MSARYPERGPLIRSDYIREGISPSFTDTPLSGWLYWYNFSSIAPCSITRSIPLSPLCLGLPRTGYLQVFPVTSIATCCSEDFCWSSLWWMIIVRSEAASRMHVDRSISLACGIFASGTGARHVTTPTDLLHLTGKSHQDNPRKGDTMERKDIPRIHEGPTNVLG